MNRVFYRVLVAVLLIAVLNTPTQAADGLTLSIGSISCSAGSEISVPIVIQNNPGIAMADLKIEYDSSALTFVSAANGTIFAQADLMESYPSGSPYPILFVSTTGDRAGDGTLITLNFRVNSNCADGNYTLTFRKGSMLSNFNETILSTSFVGGAVTVRGAQIDSVSKTTGGTTAVVSCSTQNASIYCAAYDNNGRMTGIESKPASVGQKSYAFSVGMAYRVKIFVLDNRFFPLCESKTA